MISRLLQAAFCTIRCPQRRDIISKLREDCCALLQDIAVCWQPQVGLVMLAAGGAIGLAIFEAKPEVHPRYSQDFCTTIELDYLKGCQGAAHS